MAKVKLTEDLFAPHPSGREGTSRLVGRKGALVDEALVAAAKRGTDAPAASGLVSTSSLRGEQPATAEASADPDGYDAMKVADLRDLAAERGIDHEGLKKAELVEALEDYDEA